MNDFNRLFDILEYQNANLPQEDCLVGNYSGNWKKFSTEECLKMTKQISLGLLKHGIQKGDKIALISENRPEWNLVDIAMLQLGVINVPVYPTISQEDFKFIFNNAEVKLAFVSNEELLGKAKAIKDSVPTLGDIFTFDEISGEKHWTDLIKAGRSGPFDDVENIAKNISADDLATIIYTSGTTGLPKGVMLSHNNIISNVKAVNEILPLNKDNKNLSFLPLCHIFERTVTYTYMANGCSIYYAESMETIGENLKEIKPDYFSTVPRLLEKVYDKIIAKGNDLTGVKKKLFFWALDLGMDYNFKKRSPAYNAKLKIARKLIFSKWQEALGGNVKGIMTGAAALQFRLEKVFNAAGIPVRQGYGLTETSPVLSFNRFETNEAMIGTIGKPIPGVEIRIDDKNGEILAKGPNIMMGYYKREDATNEVIDKDGWFHTGDKGEWIDGTYLRITDRIKELFKTSGGKYVAPQPLENKYKESKYIEQIMVVGNDRKFVSALIVPNRDCLESYCKSKNLSTDSLEVMNQHNEVKEIFDNILKEYNPSFGHVEQIKVYRLLSEEWTIDGAELTPTLKLKRKNILAKYEEMIEDIYNV